MNGDLAFTLAFFALMFVCIAAVAIAWVVLQKFKKRGPDPEPPVWVNHGAAPRRRCHECRAIRRSQRRAAS